MSSRWQAQRKPGVMAGVLGTVSGQVALGSSTRAEGVMEMGQVQVRKNLCHLARGRGQALKDFTEQGQVTTSAF